MRRRRLLAVTSSAVVASIAGCPGSDPGTGNGPPGDGSPTPSGPSPNQRTRSAFASAIEGELDVDEVGSDAHTGWLTLDYITDAGDESGLRSEIATIGAVYAETLHEDATFERLDVFALSPEYEIRWTFHVETEWAREFAAGDLSEDDYVDRIADTVR